MTTDAQDRIVKQLGDRYDLLRCDPQRDGSLKIEARRNGVGNVGWERYVTVAPDGKVTHDSGEEDTDVCD